MTNEDLYEMIEILMEMPKEKYSECKRKLLDLKEEKIIDFLKQLFSSIEKHRPELVEGGAA